jgi:proteic killer suppression protein
MENIFNVKLSRKAIKDLRIVPLHIAIKFQAWLDDVAHRGLREVSKITSYHDESLKGKRVGQRSIRLSQAYRAIYKILKDGKIQFIEIIEVNKHDY